MCHQCLARTFVESDECVPNDLNVRSVCLAWMCPSSPAVVPVSTNQYSEGDGCLGVGWAADMDAIQAPSLCGMSQIPIRNIGRGLAGSKHKGRLIWCRSSRCSCTKQLLQQSGAVWCVLVQLFTLPSVFVHVFLRGSCSGVTLVRLTPFFS